MAYRKIILSRFSPYHVVARANNKDRFPIPIAEFWTVVRVALLRTIKLYGIKPHCLVLMNNHIHLLVFTPNENLSLAMNHWMREMSKAVNRISGRQDHLWGKRYRWCLIDSDQYYANTYRYVLQNPIRAGLVARVEDWPYSIWMCSNARLLSDFPSAAEPWGITRMQLSRLTEWVNQPIPAHLLAGIPKALRKRIYGETVLVPICPQKVAATLGSGPGT